MGQDVDVLQAGLAALDGVAPAHELAEHAGEGEATGIRGALVVEIIEHEAEIVIAGPEQGYHLDQVGGERVA